MVKQLYWLACGEDPDEVIATVPVESEHIDEEQLDSCGKSNAEIDVQQGVTSIIEVPSCAPILDDVYASMSVVDNEEDDELEETISDSQLDDGSSTIRRC
ncbi:uncharacterized protein G2W53_017578 [Senna tora]|uniref:Uncharacterized protein n=1 Tax=Senna tora TaxID=362788 RepID=A0A834WQX7_9FABA|nr:uncharacterized protein G2W53_017578 [Senna tora]